MKERARGRRCNDCGMVTGSNEYHPYAACLIFKQTNDSQAVRTNLQAVIEWAQFQTRIRPVAPKRKPRKKPKKGTT